MFDKKLILQVKEVLDNARSSGLMIATAESCTGGLISAALTSAPGSSAVFERGFVTYSNEAKMQMLGVAAATLEQYGAVSEQTARAMAEGTLAHSRADLAVSVTGIAGPTGGSDEKPVGLVHFACARKHQAALHVEMRYGDIGRDQIRYKAVMTALGMLAGQTSSYSSLA